MSTAVPITTNISAAGARRRLLLAAAFLGVAVTGSWLMLGAELDRAWRVAYFPTFWLVGLCVFQVFEKTCVVLAVKGERETEAGGTEPVALDGDAIQLRCQARKVHLHALAFAAICTALMLAVGEL